jgi:hypothetical protein
MGIGGGIGIFVAFLGMLSFLGAGVVFIIVLVKLFQNEGAGKGILGLICGIYTYIWGWMNATRLNLKKLMLIWTVLIIVGIILYIIGGGAAMISSMSSQPTTTY